MKFYRIAESVGRLYWLRILIELLFRVVNMVDRAVDVEGLLEYTTKVERMVDSVSVVDGMFTWLWVLFFERLPLLFFQPFDQTFRSISYLTELVDLVVRLVGPTG
jgi:hypothetical protein